MHIRCKTTARREEGKEGGRYLGAALPGTVRVSTPRAVSM
ncbi:MAG: hypothetical protein ACJAZO_001690 [Myxococcota bacterium]|jgi:hypothetical protein